MTIEFSPAEIRVAYEALLPGLMTGGKEWRTACPMHRGKHPNFCINSESGYAYCHSQCGRGWDLPGFIAELHGIDFASAMNWLSQTLSRNVSANGNHNQSERWRDIAKYRYTDESGQLLYEVIRQERGHGADREKKFKCRRPDGHGGWASNLAETPRVLYNLPAVRAAKTVFLVKGEKCADRLNELLAEAKGEAIATTAPFGAGNWQPEFAEDLRAKIVITLPDNDDPGRWDVLQKAASLIGVASEFHVLEIPALAHKEDVADFIERGGTLAQIGEMVRASKPILVPSLEALRSRWRIPDHKSESVGSIQDNWLELLPIHAHTVERISEDMLPGFLGPMVSAIARATETPLELPALMGIGVVSLSIAGKVEVSPDREQDHRETTNMYICAAMESGNRKTSVLKYMLSPVVEREDELSRDTEPQRKRSLSEKKTIEAQIDQLRKRKPRADEPLEALQAAITEIESKLPDVPPPPQFWCQDITPEHLATKLAEQGGRLGLVSSEGGVFENFAGRYSKGVPNLDLILQAHEGSPVRVERASRFVLLPRPVLTICIAPQPDVLSSFSKHSEFRRRGLVARFLYALPPSPLGERRHKTVAVSASALQAYKSGIKELLNMTIKRDSTGHSIPSVLPFSRQALDAWKEFQLSIEHEMREGARLCQCRDWASKLPGQAARLAAVFHYAMYPDGKGPGEVQREQIEQALSIAGVLISHALAVFNLMQMDATVEGALRIWHWISDRRLKQFTGRECFCFHQLHFRRVDAMDPCINLLERHGYIRRHKQEGGRRGRPSELYDARPELLNESR